ncbi:Uncharacterised protein [Sebaldella termitidis]|uniref:NAD(+) hydrolase ThsA n=1 Tax=Sebaldella termitidis (strain ATCC 33386 / NCTC 11300) TaxID=526218 RepID=D1AS18_SEBTE|nr:SIR2 family protein [Sebaldella termitidis]ACZ11005.1 conserved hypothetical protein [Sebaldella termitidis ATCC 33386]SUI81098.1 Uncharacterised protein [Sebaldella termitidis]
MDRKILKFIDKYVKEINESNAAIFLGAGFSVDSGCINWKELLEDIAEDLGLDIEKESDLISLAQYHKNTLGNRSQINQLILNSYGGKDISENHRILARLPISTFWTTNYDSLIEDSLKEIKKIPDVKYTNAHLSQTEPKRDSIIYKMHGDRNHSNDTIILKEDYEEYHVKYAPFITALNGDLITKTFLFIGFSFSDPNLNYILSRMKVDYGNDTQKTHYALMKKVAKEQNEDEGDFIYRETKQKLLIDDLRRYNIQVLEIDSYKTITNILRNIEKKINRNNVFISGSAVDYGDFKEEKSVNFIENLSKQLIRKGYNIVSGFGLGVGSYVIKGALEEIYLKSKTINDNRLLLRPFPQGIENEKSRVELWKKYRKDMISRVGISIFIFGNKIGENTEIIEASGVLEEFKIAHDNNNIIIPIGCTGGASKTIWNIINNDFESYFKNSSNKLKQLFQKFNHNYEKEDELINDIINFIDITVKK